MEFGEALQVVRQISQRQFQAFQKLEEVLLTAHGADGVVRELEAKAASLRGAIGDLQAQAEATQISTDKLLGQCEARLLEETDKAEREITRIVQEVGAAEKKRDLTLMALEGSIEDARRSLQQARATSAKEIVSMQEEAKAKEATLKAEISALTERRDGLKAEVASLLAKYQG